MIIPESFYEIYHNFQAQNTHNMIKPGKLVIKN